MKVGDVLERYLVGNHKACPAIVDEDPDAEVGLKVGLGRREDDGAASLGVVGSRLVVGRVDDLRVAVEARDERLAIAVGGVGVLPVLNGRARGVPGLLATTPSFSSIPPTQRVAATTKA